MLENGRFRNDADTSGRAEPLIPNLRVACSNHAGVTTCLDATPAKSLCVSWLACRFRVLLLAEQFDVSFGLRRRLVIVLAELGDAFVSPRWLYVDDEARLIGGANDPPTRQSLIGGGEQ